MSDIPRSVVMKIKLKASKWRAKHIINDEVDDALKDFDAYCSMILSDTHIGLMLADKMRHINLLIKNYHI